MAGFPDETQLALLLAVTALIVGGSYRFARRFTPGDWSDCWLDALLGFYLVQYIAVGICGVLGMLSGGAILIAGAGIGVITLIAGRGAMREAITAQGRWILAGGAILVVSYLIGLAVRQGAAPPFDNDSLTYHLPAAVTWIQHGRIVLFDTWFHNPANTYSPLAGSMFITWLLAPLGNDALARFVQAPALLLIWLALLRLCRSLGAGPFVASLVASSAVLSRSILAQSILQKDDLFALAFFLTALDGMARTDRLAPWRAGVAMGLLLATKYTVLLSLPILLLAIDAPRRAGWRWRDVILAISLALLLAGPWYVRNWLLTGNPVYPIDSPMFAGLFATMRTPRLATLAGIWQVLAGGYYSVKPLLGAILVLGWLIAMVHLRRRWIADPIIRAVCLGPIVGVVLFVALSPYDEVRFVYPALVLLWAASALAPKPLAGLLAGALLCISLATNFIPDALRELLPYVGSVAVILAGLLAVWRMLLRPPLRIAAAGVLIVVAASYTFIYWQSYLRRLSADAVAFWQFPTLGYGSLPQAWAFVRNQLPREATLAYANTSYVYPLYGSDLSRRVIYVPPVPSVRHAHDLPSIPTPLSGEQIAPAVTGQVLSRADWAGWSQRLRESGAEYLLVVKSDLPPDSELAAAGRDPAGFRRVFDNSGASVFQIVR